MGFHLIVQKKKKVPRVEEDMGSRDPRILLVGLYIGANFLRGLFIYFFLEFKIICTLTQ